MMLFTNKTAIPIDKIIEYTNGFFLNDSKNVMENENQEAWKNPCIKASSKPSISSFSNA